jgi:hypothetical protein
VRPTEATAVVNIRNENGSWNYPLELKKFSYSPPKFLAARNRNRWKHYNDLLITTSLNIGPPIGVKIVPGTEKGEFTLRFAATMTNDLYGNDKLLGSPILYSYRLGAC